MKRIRVVPDVRPIRLIGRAEIRRLFVAFIADGPTEVRVRHTKSVKGGWVCDADGPFDSPDCKHLRVAAAHARRLWPDYPSEPKEITDAQSA